MARNFQEATLHETGDLWFRRAFQTRLKTSLEDINPRGRLLSLKAVTAQTVQMNVRTRQAHFLTSAFKIIKNQARLLTLTEELGNVLEARQAMGMSRNMLYHCK